VGGALLLLLFDHPIDKLGVQIFCFCPGCPGCLRAADNRTFKQTAAGQPLFYFADLAA
jgi:hypothetical protein